MKKDAPGREVITPEDLRIATGKSLSYWRDKIRQWKKEEGLEPEHFVIIEMAVKKTRIPYEIFRKIIDRIDNKDGNN